MKLRAALLGGFSLAALSLTSVPVVAAPYGMAGCGMGSLFIKDDGIIQVVAATFNGSFGTQTFGITSGSSNCRTDAKAAELYRQEEFFVANMSILSREIARGEGETVRALSAEFGCSDAVYDDVRLTLQGSHDYIFSAPGAVTSLERTKKVLRDQGAINQSCGSLI